MPVGSVNLSVGAALVSGVYEPGAVTEPNVRPVLSVSVSTRLEVSAALVTVAVSVNVIVCDGATVAPSTGFDDFTMWIAGSLSVCVVLHAVQFGGVELPPLGTTLLPTEPDAVLLTVAV